MIPLRDPFVAQLSSLCKRYPTRAKWVVVASHAAGHSLGDRLARSGASWANLRLVTPLDLALPMAAPFLVERGITPSEDTLGPALVMRLLLDAPAEGGYFRPLAHQPSMAEALWTTLRELRMSGLRSADLPASAFRSAAKHRELATLLLAYERYLDEHRLADIPMVYEEAPRHLAFCPVSDDAVRIEMPRAIWAPLQRQLIDALPGEVVSPHAVSCHGLAVPRRAASLAHPWTEIDPEPASDAERLRFLLRPSAAPAPLRDGSLQIFRAGGRQAEVDEVFRRIFQSSQPIDRVEIACASTALATLVWEKACRYDWPVTLAPGVPAALTRPGRALLGYCAWIESGFSAGALRRLLQSGDVTLPLGDVTAAQAARLLLAAEAGWGRATYRLSFARLIRRYRRRAGDPDLAPDRRGDARARATRAEHLLGWIEGLLRAIPEADAAADVPLLAIVEAAGAFLQASAARTSVLDAAAFVAIGDRVSELRALGAFACPLAGALRFVEACIDGLSVGRDRARPGHLHVSTLAEAGLDGRPLLFVMGLEEGRVFPPAVEDPVLLDRERAAIDPRLRRSADRLDEAVYAVVTRLATAGSDVAFSYSSRDLREFRETAPSWLVLQAYRLAAGDASATHATLQEALGPPVSCVPADPDAAPDEAAWWMAQVREAGAAGTDAVRRAYPAVAAGQAAERARDSAGFGAFDGHVPAAGSLLDPTATATPVSATTLEEAAGCPFRFFLGQGLRVEAIDERARDADVWLDHLTRGAELHALYAAILRESRANGSGSRVDAEAARALAVGRLAALRAEVPPPSDEVFERESAELLRDVDLFVAAERAAPAGVAGIGFEVSFGLPIDDADVEPLASEDPVEITLGSRRFLLRGRIDRINRIGASTFEIVDYKTGRFWEEGWKGVFARGTRLQHALYRLAAARLLTKIVRAPLVTRSVYYFTSVRGRQQLVPITDAQGSALADVLGDLFAVIRDGVFLHADDDDTCRYCDFGAACGRRPARRAAAKLATPSPTLASLHRLRRHV